MTKKDKVLIDGLKRLSQDIAEIAAALEGTEAKAKKQDEPVPEPTPTPAPAEPERVVTKEELRAFLAEKARNGYRAEIKAMLAKYGVERLSEVDDPATLTVMMTEAEEILHG